MSCPSCQFGAPVRGTSTWECVRIAKQLLNASRMAGAQDVSAELDESPWYDDTLDLVLRGMALYRGGADQEADYVHRGPVAIEGPLRALGLTSAQVECLDQARTEWRVATAPASSSWAWWLLGGIAVAGGVTAVVVVLHRKPGLGGFRAHDELHTRIAKELGWRVEDTESMSLQSLREVVRPVSPKLVHEIDVAIYAGTVVLPRQRRPRGLGVTTPWRLAPNGRDYVRCSTRRRPRKSCCATVSTAYDKSRLTVRCGGMIELARTYETAAAAMRIGDATLAAKTLQLPKLQATLGTRPRIRYRLLVRDPETGSWETFQDGLSQAKASRLAASQIRAWRGSRGQTVWVSAGDVRVEPM